MWGNLNGFNMFFIKEGLETIKMILVERKEGKKYGSINGG